MTKRQEAVEKKIRRLRRINKNQIKHKTNE